MNNDQPGMELQQAGAQEFRVFGLGREEYALDIQKVQELRGYEAVTRIANAPEFKLMSSAEMGLVEKLAAKRGNHLAGLSSLIVSGAED